MRDEDVRHPRTASRAGPYASPRTNQQDNDHIGVAAPFPAAVVTTNEQINFALPHGPTRYAAKLASNKTDLCSPVEAVVVPDLPAAERLAHTQAKKAAVR